MTGAPLHAGRAFAASFSGLVFAGYLTLLFAWRSIAGSLAVMDGVWSFWIVGLEIVGLEFMTWLLSTLVLLIERAWLFVSHWESFRIGVRAFNPKTKVLFPSASSSRRCVSEQERLWSRSVAPLFWKAWARHIW
jgi:hypothetical protein